MNIYAEMGFLPKQGMCWIFLCLVFCLMSWVFILLKHGLFQD